ncbi:MAG: cupin domain-containing protein, partial [Brevundimonas sp.]
MAASGITKFEIKSHDNPDELRTPDKTRVEVVHLSDVTLGRFNFEPGWKWSECIKPVAKTDSCQLAHIGHVMSGHLTVRMDDGTQKILSPGTSYAIPPGH